MRSAVRRLLAEDAQLPSLEELETLTLQLRGHIALLIPEVEATAGCLPKGDVPRYCALACVGEARGKLSQQARPGTGGAARNDTAGGLSDELSELRILGLPGQSGPLDLLQPLRLGNRDQPGIRRQI
ncbi:MULTISPECIES: DUF6415 family natural product biosynthesis protein [Streptomyces]|uniref:DUF6415 family natural product biosynthesis protein n=1 Tax=Streptomyces TaxID=1883 RepID=UPI0015EF093F|nr:DUF6415 family natural product biosynthesis protein [Streptomyces sp. WAC00263]KAF5991835.1 hypothetical protein BOG92_008070 [Streptomyces sp. WAC00263]